MHTQSANLQSKGRVGYPKPCKVEGHEWHLQVLLELTDNALQLRAASCAIICSALVQCRQLLCGGQLFLKMLLALCGPVADLLQLPLSLLQSRDVAIS